jgi:putative endonuclease
VTAQQPRETLGSDGERAAMRHLKSQGYRLIARNFSTRHGEIDIIAADGETLCFIEVKTRARSDFAPPHAAVNRKKQMRMRAAATAYLTTQRLHNKLCRFDVLSLVPDPARKSGWAVEHLRDAF